MFGCTNNMRCKRNRPAGFITAKSEVVFLMEALDADGDKIISAEEATAEPLTFLKSQATYFGRLYELKDLRAAVFQLGGGAK